MKNNQLEWKDYLLVAMGSFIYFALLCHAICWRFPLESEDKLESAAATKITQTTIQTQTQATETVKFAVKNDFYARECNLSYNLQKAAYDVCNDTGIAFNVALGLMEVESNFNECAKSAVGCYGLCQLNPKYFPSDLTPAENIQTGIKYLSTLVQKYDGDIEAALTAYNAGYDTGSRTYANKVLSAAEKYIF